MTKSLGDRIYDRLSERQASGDPLSRDWFVAMVETESRAAPNDDDEFSGNAWTPKQLEELRARGAKLEKRAEEIRRYGMMQRVFTPPDLLRERIEHYLKKHDIL
jgi:hypothetical protein